MMSRPDLHTKVSFLGLLKSEGLELGEAMVNIHTRQHSENL